MFMVRFFHGVKMANNKRSSFLIIMAILFVSACNLAKSSPMVIPTDTANAVKTNAVNPTDKPTAEETLTLTLPPVATATITTSPTREIMGPFQVIASLADRLDNVSDPVQVRALEDGSVWVISQHSVLRWDGKVWKEMFVTNSGFQADVDAGGQLWVVDPDRQEISVLQDEDWISYDAINGWTNTDPSDISAWAPLPWRIYPATGSTFWVPMSTDIRFFNSDHWIEYSMAEMGFPSPPIEDVSIVHSLVTAKNGSEVWVGECYYSGPGPMGGGGVRWFDGQAWYGADGPVGLNCVSAMDVDDLGNVWLGAYTHIWRYNHSDQSWVDTSLAQALLDDYNFSYPLQLTVDQTGDVWVIMEMCGGASCGVATNLYRIHQGEWFLVLESSEWTSSIRQVALDTDGRPWLFWENMLYRLDGDMNQPVAQINTRGLGVSPSGVIWLVADSRSDTKILVLHP
jgi:hypothetical protein